MTQEPELRLDDQLCFALYAASRAMTARYRPQLEALGLTYPQYLVLLVLWDEGPTTVAGLGERLRLDSGTLSPLLRRLEDGALISRERSTTDERSVIVTATARSVRLRAEAACIPDRITASVAGSPDVTDLDLDGLRTDLRRLETALRDTHRPRP